MLLLVPRQVLFPRRRVLAEVALVPLQLLPVDAPRVLPQHNRIRPEVAPLTFERLALRGSSIDSFGLT